MIDQQTQLPLDQPPPILRVIDDYGPVGMGASRARIVLAENLQEYMVKGPSLVPSHPHVAANEYIAARLAQAIGLPILDFTVVELGGEALFASAWMDKGTFHPETTEALFNRCENRDPITISSSSMPGSPTSTDTPATCLCAKYGRAEPKTRAANCSATTTAIAWSDPTSKQACSQGASMRPLETTFRSTLC